MFSRRIVLFLTVAAVTAAAMTAFVATRVPRYESSAQIEIKGNRQLPVVPAAVSGKADDGVVGTQMKHIASRAVAASVVDDLGLASDPYWVPQPGRVARMLGAAPIPAGDLRRTVAVNALMTRLSITRDDVAPVVTITVLAADPAQAAAIVNGVGQAYLRETAAASRASTASRSRILNRQLDRLAADVESADAALAAYRTAHGLNAPAPVTGGAVDQQAAALATQLASAQSEAAADQAKAAVASDMIAAGRVDAVTDVLQSPVVADLRQQRETIAAQAADARARYGPKHPAIISLTAQLANIDAAIRQEQSRIVSGVNATARAATKRMSNVKNALVVARGEQAADTTAQVGADQLARIADTRRATYVELAQAAARSEQEGATDVVPGSIIASGVPALAPTYPKTALLLMLGLLAAPAMGAAAVLAAEALDTRVRGPEELAAIPGARHLSSVAKVSERTLKRLHRRARPWDYALARPMSSFAESVRAIRTRLADGRIDGTGLVVLVTSAMSGEGKSTLSASLARTMALAGDRVLLIDGDLRRNGLAALLHDPPETGLGEVLEGDSRYDEAIVRDAAPGLDVLPLSGPQFTPHDVFGDGRMATLLTNLRDHYDFVVVDGPPVLAVDDAATLAGLADRVVLAVHWGRTRIDSINLAAARLREAGGAAIGIVLTAVDPNATAASYRGADLYLSAPPGYHRN